MLFRSIKQIDIFPSFFVGNDWMCAPLMVHLTCETSLYCNDPHFKDTYTIFFVHNNGQDYQFRVPYMQNGVNLLENFGLRAIDGSGNLTEEGKMFLDPHDPNLMNLIAAGIRPERRHFVGTVSPGQLFDFLASDNKGGGEGLRYLYIEKKKQNRLFAITNGIQLEARQNDLFGFCFRDIDRTDRVAVRKAMDHIKAMQKKSRKEIATNYPEFFSHSEGISTYLVDDDYFVVTMVTRVTKQKGVNYVASFVRKVFHSGKKVVFLFVGDGDTQLMGQLKSLVKEFPGLVGYPGKGISDQDPIYFHMYLAGDLYLAFSTWEPGGISPMEALAFLTAVLASDKQGHKSTIKSVYVKALKDLLGVYDDEPGFNGARFPIDDNSKDDTINHAYQAFETLFSAWENRHKDGKWEELLENAFFSDNSWQRVVGEFEVLFKNVLEFDRVSSSLTLSKLLDSTEKMIEAFKTKEILKIIPEFKELIPLPSVSGGHRTFSLYLRTLESFKILLKEESQGSWGYAPAQMRAVRAALLFRDLGDSEVVVQKYQDRRLIPWEGNERRIEQIRVADRKSVV